VIPVVLADAPDKPQLPAFLRGMTWVDFRVGDPNPMERLVVRDYGDQTLKLRENCNNAESGSFSGK